MEDRVTVRPLAHAGERRGGALSALVIILLITGAWWALALWPVGAVEPEWLARTRAACFGSPRGGLPDAGGWILLIGEPAGMIAALLVGWRRSLRNDLRWIVGFPIGRAALAGAAALGVLGTASIGVRVSRLRAVGGASFDPIGAPHRIDSAFPDVALVDQHGGRETVAGFRGRKALLTFAYGHCSTVCPATVSALAAARRDAKRENVPIVVLTVDPWRDTPERLPTLARHWHLGPEDRVLSGTVEDVERALDALGVGRLRNVTNGEIDHAGVAMIIDEGGRITWRVDGGPSSVAMLAGKL